MTHLVIVGGSDAGISAALRAREIDEQAMVTVVVADAFPNYSICGLPFYLSGETPEWQALAHRTREELAATGMTLLLNHAARVIDSASHTVSVRDPEGQEQTLSYDRLILATGAVPRRPAIAGLDLPGVFLLHSMAESFALHDYLQTRSPRSALIVGGGYIGLEMADALTLRGIAVTVVEHGSSVLKTVDASFGARVGDELRQHGVEVVVGVQVERIMSKDEGLQVSGSQDFHLVTDMVLVATGVQPSTALAITAGADQGAYGAIRVNQFMETNVPDLLAAGDCVETSHRLLQQHTYLPLGTTAHKQGRVAGERALGGTRPFEGSLGTQVVKVCNLVIARTGLRDHQAREAGFDPLTVEVSTWDHKVYYPGAKPLFLRLTGDRRSGRFLGAQVLGSWHSEIAKRVDILATALFHEMTIDALSDLDLSYTPPLSSPWDPVQMSAQTWVHSWQMAHP
jgi:NADPH-dependent 2,4-dienoyl-CoA reductase/sulfur reductase-like enzyme